MMSIVYVINESNCVASNCATLPMHVSFAHTYHVLFVGRVHQLKAIQHDWCVAEILARTYRQDHRWMLNGSDHHAFQIPDQPNLNRRPVCVFHLNAGGIKTSSIASS